MMKLTTVQSTLKRVRADTVALFIPQEPELFRKEISAIRKLMGRRIDRAVDLEKFEGKEGEVLALFSEGGIAAPRLVLAGLGSQKAEHPRALEAHRRAAAAAAKRARSSNVKHLAFALPPAPAGMDILELAGALIEGAVLSLYSYDKYFTDKERVEKRVRELTLFDPASGTVTLLKKAVRDARIVCE